MKLTVAVLISVIVYRYVIITDQIRYKTTNLARTFRLYSEIKVYLCPQQVRLPGLRVVCPHRQAVTCSEFIEGGSSTSFNRTSPDFRIPDTARLVD